VTFGRRCERDGRGRHRRDGGVHGSGFFVCGWCRYAAGDERDEEGPGIAAKAPCG
jgi:hypothetical protein